jgi:hypothetical protein
MRSDHMRAKLKEAGGHLAKENPPARAKGCAWKDTLTNAQIEMVFRR